MGIQSLLPVAVPVPLCAGSNSVMSRNYSHRHCFELNVFFKVWTSKTASWMIKGLLQLCFDDKIGRLNW